MNSQKIYLVLEIETNQDNNWHYRLFPGWQGGALIQALQLYTVEGSGMLARWNIKCLLANGPLGPAFYNGDSTAMDAIIEKLKETQI